LHSTGMIGLALKQLIPGQILMQFKITHYGS
jgi:hypothetical protein